MAYLLAKSVNIVKGKMASRLFLCGRLSAQFSFVSLAGKSMSLQRLCISRFHLASAFFGERQFSFCVLVVDAGLQ